MANFVDKVKKDSTEYDIHDTRIPAAEAVDAGKVLKVADAGGYELGEAGDGVSVKIVGSSVVLLDQPEPESWEIDGVIYKHRIVTSELIQPSETKNETYYYFDLEALVGPVRSDAGLIYSYLINAFAGSTERGWKVRSSDTGDMGKRCEVKISSSRANGLQGESSVIEVSETIKNNTLNANYFANGYLDVNDGQYGIFYFNLVDE